MTADSAGTARPGSFGFIIHPPTLDYVRRAVAATRVLPDAVLRWLLPRRRPMFGSRITGVRSKLGHSVDGCFIICPLLPAQMLQLDTGFVLDRIVQAGRMAERRGASIVGLGAYTSIVGDKGYTVARSLGIAVTSGSSMTAWAAVEALNRLAAERDGDQPEATLAVVGATGSIGSLCTRKLARTVKRVVVTARHRERLELLKDDVRRTEGIDVEIEMDVHRAIAGADLVITTTSAPDALFTADELKSGSATVDVSVPKNISAVANPRRDVRIADGGLVRLPAIPEYSIAMGLEPGVVYACMAETMLLTLEGRFQSFSLGDGISVDKVDEIGALARKHGFDVWLGPSSPATG